MEGHFWLDSNPRPRLWEGAAVKRDKTVSELGVLPMMIQLLKN